MYSRKHAPVNSIKKRNYCRSFNIFLWGKKGSLSGSLNGDCVSILAGLGDFTDGRTSHIVVNAKPQINPSQNLQIVENLFRSEIMMMRTAFQRSASRSLRPTARMMSGKEIKFGVEGRAAMLRGVDLLADAVQVRRWNVCFGWWT